MMGSVHATEDNACFIRNIRRKGTRLLWEITRQCNMSCLHCLCDECPSPELPAERWQYVTSRLTDMNVGKVGLTGGEPFLVPGVMGLLEEIRKLSVPIDINTNLLCVDRQTTSALVDIGVEEITTSIDGSEHSHDTLRQKAGARTTTLRNMEALVAGGVKVDVVFVLTKLNYRDIPETTRLLMAAGANSLTISDLIPRGRAVRNWTELCCSPCELEHAIRGIKEVRATYPQFPVRTCRVIRHAPLQKCPTGSSFLAIDCYGMVRGCLVLRSDASVPVSQLSLPQTQIPALLRSLAPPTIGCRTATCNCRQDCGYGCPAFAETSQSGPPFDPLCRQAAGTEERDYGHHSGDNS